jgi:hypothetical protein
LFLGRSCRPTQPEGALTLSEVYNTFEIRLSFVSLASHGMMST